MKLVDPEGDAPSTARCHHAVILFHHKPIQLVERGEFESPLDGCGPPVLPLTLSPHLKYQEGGNRIHSPCSQGTCATTTPHPVDIGQGGRNRIFTPSSRNLRATITPHPVIIGDVDAIRTHIVTLCRRTPNHSATTS